MNLSFPYQPFYYSSKATCDPVLTEAISAHLSGDDGFSLQESVKREEDQCNYETYQQGSISSTSSSVKLSRLSSTDGVNEFYSLNTNQDIDTSFGDFDLGRGDELDGVARGKEETFINNHNSLSRGGGYDEVIFSPKAISVSEGVEDEEDDFDSGISSLHLTPNDTDGLSSEKNVTSSKGLNLFKKEVYDDSPPQLCFESRVPCQQQPVVNNRSRRTRNRLAYSTSFPPVRSDPYSLEARKLRVGRITLGNQQHTISESHFINIERCNDDGDADDGDGMFYYDGDKNCVGPEGDSKSKIYPGDEYFLSSHFDSSSNLSLARIPQGYQMEAGNTSSFYRTRPLDQIASAAVYTPTNQNHSVRRYTDDYPHNAQNCVTSNSSFYSSGYFNTNSVFTNPTRISPQRPSLLPCSPNTSCLSQRSFLKRNENRARKACLQNSSDFYHYSDENNLGCDPSPFLSSYQNVTDRARGKIGNSSPLKNRVSRPILSSGYPKSGIIGIRNFINHHDTSESRRFQSRSNPGGTAGTGSGRRRHLLSFILELLKRRQSCVEWVNKTDQVFQIVNPDQLTRLWGEYKNNKRMTFESLSRSLRLYYAPGKLERIQGLRHHYRLLCHVLPPESDSEVNPQSLRKPYSSEHRRGVVEFG